MGKMIRLTAADGHGFGAYHAQPRDMRAGGVIVVQEIFGVNAHIRDVCDWLAEAGYEAVAPALFDRLTPGVDLGYDEAGITEGRELVGRLGWETPVTDIRAAAQFLDPDLRVGVVGYCWGGTITWLAACRLPIACAAPYYGRQIIDFVDEKPQCPMVMHFGAVDPLIPQDVVERIGEAHPDIPIHVYEGAGHGFNCDRRADWRPEAASLARARTLALFARHLNAI